MKRSAAVIWLVILVLAAAWQGALAEAGPTGGQVVWEADFSRGLPAGCEVKAGKWKVEADKLEGQATTYLSYILLPGGELQDVALQAEVSFEAAQNPTRWLSLVVRAAGQPVSWVQFACRRECARTSGLEAAWLVHPESTWRILGKSSCKQNFALHEVHTLRVEVQGNMFRGFVDGKLKVEALLPPELVRKGRAALVVSGVTARFGKVRLERLPHAEQVLAQVGLLPLIISHRGASKEAPENTLPAFEKAFAEGADGVETDVRTTKDGVLVVMHDSTVDRTTNGKGAVNSLTLAELKALDAGVKKGPEYAGTKVPTLEEVADLVLPKGLLFLDLKQEGMGRQLAALLKSKPHSDRVIFNCWTDTQVKEVLEYWPGAHIIRLGSAPQEVSDEWFAKQRALGVEGFSFEDYSISPRFLAAAKRQFMPVFAWTVDDEGRMEINLLRGVWGILTDEPAKLKALEAQLAQRLGKASEGGQGQ